MKIIIAGTRTFSNYNILLKAIEEANFEITEIVSGTARGVDRLGERYGSDYEIPVKFFKPEWYLFGNAAGPLRNLEMVNYAEGLIALWDGKSRGTADIIRQAQEKKLKIFIFKI